MAEVGILEAKNRLAEMIDKAARGEETIITRRGKAVAKLVAVDATAGQTARQTARKAASKSDRKASTTRARVAAPFDWDDWKKQRDKDQKKARAKTRK